MRRLWTRALDWAYDLGASPSWWVWDVAVAALAVALRAILPSPWSWLTAAPLFLLALLIFDGRARWQRDDRRLRRAAAPPTDT
jgi:hypothetical protein